MGTKVTFEIPYPDKKSEFCRRFGLNAYWSGKSWQARKRDSDYLHEITIVSMLQNKVRRRPMAAPVRIRFDWDDGLDIDNHAVIGKCVVDAMKGYVLEDDNPRRYSEVTHRFWHGGCIRVTVEAMP